MSMSLNLKISYIYLLQFNLISSINISFTPFRSVHSTRFKTIPTVSTILNILVCYLLVKYLNRLLLTLPYPLVTYIWLSLLPIPLLLLWILLHPLFIVPMFTIITFLKLIHLNSRVYATFKQSLKYPCHFLLYSFLLPYKSSYCHFLLSW